MNIALVDDMPREITRLSGIIEEYATEHQLPVEFKDIRKCGGTAWVIPSAPIYPYLHGHIHGRHDRRGSGKKDP